MNIEELQKQPIHSQINERECRILYKYAKEGHGKGAIVEIGSGTSTLYLALGSKEVNREKVITIDIDNTFPKGFGVEDWIEELKGDSIEIGKSWNRPIRLLFIDGDHEYSHVKEEYLLFEPFLVIGGIIIFHDAIPTKEGPYGVVEKYILHSRKFTDKEFIKDSPECGMFIARKVG